ncbi:hypothetical protein ACUR5C_15625 [Aliikangiella sp. IMCC44653]
MTEVSRNIVLDLLPVYLAGEASTETQDLINAFARSDAEIARLIESDSELFLTKSINLPCSSDLSITTLQKIRREFKRRMVLVAVFTLLVLMLPLIAMQFTNEVNWSAADFLVMGGLLMLAGLSYVFLLSFAQHWSYRLAAALCALASLLLIWVNLAVGIIGAANNPLNLLFAGVILVVLVSVLNAKRNHGILVKGMYTAATLQMIIPILVLTLGDEQLVLDQQGFTSMMVCGILAAMFVVSGVLFDRNKQACS